jgi:hypothetical protein
MNHYRCSPLQFCLKEVLVAVGLELDHAEWLDGALVAYACPEMGLTVESDRELEHGIRRQ